MSKPQDESRSKGTVQGEGDYEAARRYREGVAEFVKKTDLKSANQQPQSAAEAREDALAEKSGKARSKGDDPADVGIMYERSTPTPRRDDAQTAERAYQLWQARGAPHGSSHDDWYEAERQLSGTGTKADKTKDK